MGKSHLVSDRQGKCGKKGKARKNESLDYKPTFFLGIRVRQALFLPEKIMVLLFVFLILIGEFGVDGKNF